MQPNDITEGYWYCVNHYSGDECIVHVKGDAPFMRVRCVNFTVDCEASDYTWLGPVPSYEKSQAALELMRDIAEGACR